MTLLGEPNLLPSTPYGGVDGATPKISTLKLQVSPASGRAEHGRNYRA
jgi:hypothetical protein